MHKQNGFGHLWLFVVILLAVVGFASWRVYDNNKQKSGSNTTYNVSSAGSWSTDKAIAAGKSLSGSQCEGSGTTAFTHLPMNASDFSILVPYGVTVGGHVTPVDHQYFTPANFHSAKDTYPVYAMVDSKITGIEVHPTRIRLVFTVSCTLIYYYDLVTSVEPGIDDKHLPISVKAGQLIGHIGGQTLDFAVWNTEKPLSGFINPDSYQAEPWKIFTADPFPFFTPDLRQIIEAKDPRVAEPIAGKIDYDIYGKLIGNWFLQGSGGYHAASNQAQFYWAGHLSIAPDLYDPSATVFSIGNYNDYPLLGPNYDTSTGDGSAARQYMAKPGSQDPAKVGQSNGVVKYELVQRDWATPDGQRWDNMTLYKGIKAAPGNTVIGTILVQLTGKRELKVEVFRGLSASQVKDFDSGAKIYTR